MPNWKSIYAWGGHCIFPRFYAPMTHKIVEFAWCILTLKIAEKSGNIRHACKTLKEENDGNSMYALAPIKWNFSESAWHLACNSMENLQNRTKAKPNEWNNNYDFKIFILVLVLILSNFHLWLNMFILQLCIFNFIYVCNFFLFCFSLLSLILQCKF